MSFHLHSGDVCWCVIQSRYKYHLYILYIWFGQTLYLVKPDDGQTTTHNGAIVMSAYIQLSEYGAKVERCVYYLNIWVRYVSVAKFEICYFLLISFYFISLPLGICPNIAVDYIVIIDVWLLSFVFKQVIFSLLIFHHDILIIVICILYANNID